ncbi:kinase-like domain-containing protein [Lobosporangium transversale]|uniref:Kinase-like domain-containing protein n=1 Tax=Lobosporangium transversale TaxID=64571 RepID=A0A1Y2H1W3_9FUNG|nr:kinase-like domain-containing protein [Lobosporangium transversale]ORZ28525.1 kinase-like domain-containing protein [Lobosporangium transversale]|eukprot:XP_021886210.1 kinase-like domain-containing protein [Lobosporangium transversale]
MVDKLGEGTFGEVHKARRKGSGELLALKRILMHNENEGIPITALREIKILKRLRHENIVPLHDIAVNPGSRSGRSRASVYMVFPYMDHDLSGLLNNPRVRLSVPQIKLYMKQLLEGTIYMHAQKILHRDMKAANLLISNNGTLKIADFGLARPFKPEGEDYTSKVVTRWYRPPELFLGQKKYGPAVDMWGIGCVFGEMLFGRPVLQGSSDQDQLDKIFQLCGSPTEETMPGWSSLPGLEEKGVVYQVNRNYPRKLKEDFEPYGTLAADLMDKLLVLDPKKRLTAFAAADHDYLWVEPLPAEIGALPVYESSHEYDRQRKHEQQQERHASHHHNNHTNHHHASQNVHGHHMPPRHGGPPGGSAAPYRPSGGYGPDHERRDRPRAPPTNTQPPTTYKPIPLPPRPQTSAVPPAAPSTSSTNTTRRP